MPIPVATSSKAWMCRRSLTGDCGFENRLGLEGPSVVIVVCVFKAEASAAS